MEWYHLNSNGYPDIFDHARTTCDTGDIAWRQPTTVIHSGGMVESGSTVFIWSGMRYPANFNRYRHILDLAQITCDTADIARRRKLGVIVEIAVTSSSVQDK